MGRSGGFAPVTLPLFQGTRFWGVGAHSTAWSYSSVTEDEKHVPRALESGQLSGHCGLRIRSSGERPGAIDPEPTSVRTIPPHYGGIYREAYLELAERFLRLKEGTTTPSSALISSR